MSRFLLVFCLCATAAFPQVAARRSVVRASGEGVVSIKPDQTKVSIGVNTTAATAQEASDLNATETNKVLAALRQVLGANADIRTIGYNLFQTRDPRTNQPNGFTATNTVQVTMNDTTSAGRVIDAAAAAGATNITGISFTLKDPQPARQQALRLAAMQAKSNAEAIATALGQRLGTVMVAEDGSSVRVTTVDNRLTAGVGATTPIEMGNVDVRATVAIEAEMMP